MRVLFAVDGSANSFEAVSQVGRLLTAGRDEVAFYCSPPEFRLQPSAISPDMLSRTRQALANSIIDEAKSKLPTDLQGSVHTIVGTRDARQGIVVAAEQWPAELVVVGARGLGRFERLLLGSVSRAVVHAAQMPVWVARSKGASAEGGLRMLLACESPELGRPAAELLARLSWPVGSECLALTVVPSIFGGQVPDWLDKKARSPDVESMVQAWVREHDEEMRANVARMQGFIASLPVGLPACRPLAPEGDAACEILAIASREKADLIVVGSHRKGFLGSAILGSTSEAVLNHADCSVLIVPHQETP